MIGPSVVVGLGSSGAYVLANLERILYEVVGDAPLDVFEFYAIDTDMQRKEDTAPPGRKRTRTIVAYEQNLGSAIHDLKAILGDDFNWCPEDLRIPASGAGNLRSGGRAMLFNRFPAIWNLIRESTARVVQEASRPRVEQTLQDLMRRRGLLEDNTVVINADRVQHPVVYVVGTLAGGTCSGMCVDLGYAIRDAAPNAERVGTFFIPDRSVPPVFLENTWAALRDLEYFSDHPADFKTVWPSASRTPHHYHGGPAKPYDWVYLVSPQNESRAQVLPYSANSNSPLIVMTAMQLAIDLLGAHEPRMARLSNLNQHVADPKRRVFLNFNLRAVSYPKYEISEAAACKYVSENICQQSWLNDREYQGATGRATLEEENIRSLGRKLWNSQFGALWAGAIAAVEPQHWIRQILEHNLPQPHEDLVIQFSGDAQGTIYNQVAQQLPTREMGLKRMVRENLALQMMKSRSIRFVELYLEGVRAELAHTLRYWHELGIPDSHNQAGWLEKSKGLIGQFLRKHSSLLNRSLGERELLLQDEFEELLTYLRMYLLRDTLRGIENWLQQEILPWMSVVRSTIQTVSRLANERGANLLATLNDAGGPVLKLSRSREEGFTSEISSLATQRLQLEVNYIRLNAAGDFEGLLALHDGNSEQTIFRELKDLVQQALLNTLEAKGAVDIVEEVKHQQQINAALIRRRNAFDMSVATQHRLQKDHNIVPALLLAKNEGTARALDQVLQNHHGDLSSLEPKGIPFFDHMAFFYQEGADFDLSALVDQEFFERSYQAKLQQRPDNLDPLRLMKSSGVTPNADRPAGA